MELINPDANYNFMRKVGAAFKLSLLLILISVGSLLYQGGPNWGVEFTGGTELHLKFQKNVGTEKIREVFLSTGYKPQAVQQLGLTSDNEFLVRFSSETVSFDKIEEFQTKFGQVIKKIEEFKGAKILRIDYVGPQVGKELINKAVLSVLLGCIGILIYIMIRFEFAFAMGAVLALLHDTIITIGAISITGKEFTLAIVAALLTVIGYSVNDTIVIFDRVREVMRKSGPGDLASVFNQGINQTISRTIFTSATVFIVLICLFVFGGSVIHDFAFTLIVGTIVGTYSSIFIASGFALYWKRRSEGADTKKG